MTEFNRKRLQILVSSTFSDLIPEPTTAPHEEKDHLLNHL